MERFEFERGLGGQSLNVGVSAGAVSVASGRGRARSMDYADLDGGRWYHVKSADRQDFGLVLTGRGRKIVISCVASYVSEANRQAFEACVSALLGAIAERRPDLEVTSGVSPATAWVIFAALAVPALSGLAFGAVVIGDAGGAGF